MTYREIAGGPKNWVRLVALGSTAHICKNFALTPALMPKQYGFENELIQMLFIVGAIALSHPFEVARVLIVDGEKSHLTGYTWRTLKALYGNEGIAGLYRGFVPRTLHMIPSLMMLNYLIDSRENWQLEKVAGFSDNQDE